MEFGGQDGFCRRTNCRGCGSSRLSSFLDYGTLPLAGDFILARQLGQESVLPLDLAVCEDCTLVQVPNVVSAERLFTDYRYLSSVTRTLIGHFQNYASLIRRDLLPRSDGLVVEFGCNDGVLLSPLQELGVRAVGVDAAPNVVEIAQSRGLDVRHGFFGRATADEIRSEHGPAAVITASNVFAHIDDLDEVLLGVDRLLDRNGVFVVEVHYVIDLLETFQFDTVYHEHLCYYSIHALTRLLERFGLAIVGVQHLPMHGGAIRVFSQRQTEACLQPGELPERYLERERNYAVNAAETYFEFGDRVRACRQDLRAFLRERSSQGHTMCAYGAAGRATTLLNYCGFDTSLLRYVVDESPSRIGRYVPGVHIPIVDRDYFATHPVQDCLITAWNYRDEIIAKEQSFAERGGTFLLPLPQIEVLSGAAACRRAA
jgi:predicted TPR repeat methyltransferase